MNDSSERQFLSERKEINSFNFSGIEGKRARIKELRLNLNESGSFFFILKRFKKNYHTYKFEII